MFHPFVLVVPQVPFPLFSSFQASNNSLLNVFHFAMRQNWPTTKYSEISEILKLKNNINCCKKDQLQFLQKLSVRIKLKNSKVFCPLY